MNIRKAASTLVLAGAIAGTSLAVSEQVADAATGYDVQVSQNCQAANNQSTVTVNFANWGLSYGWWGRIRVSYWDVNKRRWAKIGNWSDVITSSDAFTFRSVVTLPDGAYSKVVEVQSRVGDGLSFGPNLPVSERWTDNYNVYGAWFPASYCYV